VVACVSYVKTYRWILHVNRFTAEEEMIRFRVKLLWTKIAEVWFVFQLQQATTQSELNQEHKNYFLL